MDTTNKPVAWLVQYKDRHEFRWSKPVRLYEALACEPLYTHPVKELTDKEIIELADTHLVLVNEYIGCGDYVSNIEGEIAFARAILRKAQEK